MRPPARPLPRWAERIGGLGLVGLGLWLVPAVWTQAAETGAFNVAGAAFGPFAVVLGAGLLLFFSPRTEQTLWGDVPGAPRLSGRWAVVMAVAVALAFAHVVALLLS